MGRLIVLFLFLSTFALSQDLKESLKAFFEREGYVLKVEGNKILVDVKDLKKGEELVLFQGGQGDYPSNNQAVFR
jgi:hypothetical protein